MRWKTRKNVKSSCMLSRPNWNQILIKRFSRNCKKFCWLVNRCLTNVRRSTRNPYSRNLNNAKGKLTRCRKITARLWWASTDGYFWDMLYSLFISMYISDRAQNWICEARGFGRGQACWSYARLTACTCVPLTLQHGSWRAISNHYRASPWKSNSRDNFWKRFCCTTHDARKTHRGREPSCFASLHMPQKFLILSTWNECCPVKCTWSRH